MTVPSHILITGGAGFAGASLACRLRQEWPDTRVTALDNLKRRGVELNLPRLRDCGVTFHHGDVRNREDLEAIGHFDILLECSAEPSVLAGYGESPDYVVQTNLTGAINCFEYARRHRAGILFLSSSRVYPIAPLNRIALETDESRFRIQDKQPFPGISPNGIREDFPIQGTRSLYGATKLAAELLLAEYGAMYDLPYIINRCGVLAGPGQMGKTDQGVVTLWVARHVFGGSLAYIGYGGKGLQVRDILHIDDLAALVQYQVSHLEQLNGSTFNVGGGPENAISLRELTTLCERQTGNTIRITAQPETRPADIPLYITDNTRVTESTGWRPTIPVSTIVSDIHQWLETNRSQLRPLFFAP